MVCHCKLFCHFFFLSPSFFPPKLINGGGGEKKRVVIFTAKKKKRKEKKQEKKRRKKSTHILGLAVTLIASLSLWKAVSLTTFQFARWCFTARSQVTRLLHGLKAVHFFFF